MEPADIAAVLECLDGFYCQLHAEVFDFLVVVLEYGIVNLGIREIASGRRLTLMLISFCEMESGTRVPTSLVTLLKEEKVWIGIIPGTTGTLIP
jgi:hypothetical protein